jgi:hydroxyacylglutathione hydrolase
MNFSSLGRIFSSPRQEVYFQIHSAIFSFPIFALKIAPPMKSWTTPSGHTLTRILFGRCNVYHISNGHTCLLVDTGIKAEGKKLIQRLKELGKPDFVFMTHTHFDHAGNAGLLKEHFSPKFIVQESEAGFLENGDSPIPKGNMGWTRFLYKLGPHRVPHWFHVQGVKADIVFEDHLDISHLGFNARLIHTPGHSCGSACLIVDDQIVIAGDALGGMPGAVFPPWGDDARGIVLSWQKLLSSGCQTFHPAHGFVIERPRLEREFIKRNSQSPSPLTII